MPSSSRWLIRLEAREPVRSQLVCLPFAGGGTATFHAWRDHLPAEVELLLVQLPGRDARLFDAPFTRLVPLAGALAQVLEPELDAAPLAFFGHSMGALIAFELARALRGRGGPLPQRMFVSGCRAPHLPDRNAPLHTRPDRDLVEELQRFNGTPPSLLSNRELMSLVLPTLRADFEVCETYRHTVEPPLACGITTFGGTEDPRVSRDELAAWRHHSAADHDLVMLPGDHFFLYSSRSLLLRELAERLVELGRSATRPQDPQAPGPRGPARSCPA